MTTTATRSSTRPLSIVTTAAAATRDESIRGFSYTSETHEAKVGPLEISISEKQRVNVPMWAGVALVIAGGGLLLMQRQDVK